MKLFKKEELQLAVDADSNELDLIAEEIVDQGRWTTQYEAILKHKESGKYYKAFYDRGSTESQDCVPFEFSNDEISLPEVHKVEKIVEVWELKE